MITYKDIEAAVQPLQKVDIKGKAYVQVAERIKAFRTLWPNGSIVTEIIEHRPINDGVMSLMIRATASDEHGNILSTGTAWERSDSSYINKSSYVENCETSAVGRALGFIALGVDAGMASAEELANAITQQQDIKRREQEPVEPKAAPTKSATVSDPTNFQIAMEWCNTVGITLDSFKNYVQAAIKNGAAPNKKVNDMTDDEFNELLKWVSANAS